jgi:hypothetical protein
MLLHTFDFSVDDRSPMHSSRWDWKWEVGFSEAIRAVVVEKRGFGKQRPVAENPTFQAQQLSDPLICTRMKSTPSPEPPGSRELEEIWFPIEKDADGYPKSKSWEGLLSRASQTGFVIESVPFYLKNVARGDVVAVEKTDLLRFSHVVERGGHNTYRLLMDEAPADEIERAQRELQERGLKVERNETGILLAVDVPPSEAQAEVDRYLIQNKEAGRWQLQDGHMNKIIIS